MVCLELMTGEDPFPELELDLAVAFEVSKGRLPKRPGPETTSRGLTDGLWALMLKCWGKPDDRCTMAEIKVAIKHLREESGTVTIPGWYFIRVP